MSTEIDPQLPFVQVARGSAAQAASLAPVLGVTYQHARGALVVLWEGMAQRSFLARFASRGAVVLTDAEARTRFRLAFGVEVEPEMAEAAGFLERVADGWRVRGMSRYLNAETARAKRKGANPTPPRSHRVATPVPPGSHPDDTPVAPGSHPGVNPQTLDVRRETRDVRLEKKQQPQLQGGNPPDLVGGAAFFAWAQRERLEAGLAAEKPPHPAKLAAWWSEAMLELNGDEQRLKDALPAFAVDPYWRGQAPPCPFPGFMSQWRNFIQQRRSA